MADVLVNDRSLMDIGDALRRKHGETKPGKEPINVPFLYEVKAPEDLELSGGVYLKDIEVNAPGAVKYRVSIRFETISGSANYREVYIMNGTNNYYYQEDMTATITSNNGKLTLRVQMSNFGVNNGHSYKVNFILYPLDADGNIREDIDIELPNTYLVSEMSGAIDDIVPYVEPKVESITITANGTYTPSIGVDGFNPVVVDIDIPTDGIPDEAFNISGNMMYKFSSGTWDWFIELYGDKITTKALIAPTNMFDSSEVERIPFKLNFTDTSSGVSFSNTFYNCKNLKEVPEISYVKCNETKNMFYGCNSLRYLPEDIESWFNWSFMDAATSGYSYNRSGTFDKCSSLRSVPMGFLSHGNPVVTYTYSIYNCGFRMCYALDELIGLPIPHLNANWTSNAFSTTFDYCYRLKEMTFALQEDDTPYTVNWSKQTIDLSSYIGYAQLEKNILNYNSGITADKRVTDDATYQALKNDADWYTSDINYARFNHTSAVNTINSLPITTGTGNTIKFKGASGALTDGGAINTLTEEEIAVAAARGWTITLV